jgi:D-beta-D-heptose 7-phosphate kinase / D-beta-D-heptose 1-phosphate adenosyltransferase
MAGLLSTTLPIERFQQLRILVIGDVMLDRYVYGSIERMSPEAPVPVLRIERERAMAGGAANVARNISALGARAALIGLVGEDAAATALRRALAEDRSIEALLVADPTRPTTVKSRYVAAGQQLLRADEETAQAADADRERALLGAIDRALPEADLLLLSDYAKGTLTDRVLAGAVERAHKAGKRVIADPKHRDFARYRGADLLTPNRVETTLAAGLPCGDDAEAAAAARRIMEQTGIPAVLVTRGDQGMTLARKGAPSLHLPAEAREVFDVSGAGDTVLAALGLGLAAGLSLDDAAGFANLAAGIVVGKAGTAQVYPGDLVAVLHAREVDRSSDAKIVDLPAALERIAVWREQGQKIGFTNGCFDLIHPGHVALLAAARAKCDRLVVGLNTDASVKRLKGADRPMQNEQVRAIVLAALAAVDLVLPFAEDTPQRQIEAIRPDVLVKGADYRLDQVVGGAFVQSYGGRVELVEIKPGHSTTETIRRIGHAT